MNIRWLYPLLCLILILASGQAHAQQQAVTWDIAVGFDGSFKTDSWFPVVVTVSNSGPDLRATLSISFPGGSTAYRQAVDLPSGANKRLVVPVMSQGSDFGNSRMSVTLREGSTVIRSETLTLRPIGRGWNVIGVISEEDGALAELGAFEERNASPTSLVRLKSSDLPDRVELLEALDALFVQGVDTRTWTDQQRAALRAWIETGGRLVVGGDERVTGGLADWLPAAVGGSGSPSNLQGLKATGWALRDDARQLPLLQLTPTANAQVIASGEAGQPLLVRRAYGAGQIIQAAFDLQAVRDAGNPVGLWAPVLSLDQETRSLAEGLRSQGFSVLRESLRLPQLSFLSGLGLFGFLGAYILIVGPVNYLILRRLNRREWAYFTIPLWVLLFSIGAYAWGTIGRGSATLVNQLGLVLVPQQAEQGKALVYLSVFSPTRSTYDLGFAPDAFVSNGVLDWQRSGANWDVLYTESGVQVPDLAVDVGGISVLAVEQPISTPKLSAILRTVNGEQQMTIRNLSDRQLTDVILFRGDGKVQEIDVLEPGADRTVVLNPDHYYYDFLRISDGEHVQRQNVIRQIGSAIQPIGFENFGVPPDGAFAEPAMPVGAYPQPAEVPQLPTPTATPTPTPGGPTATPGEAVPAGTASPIAVDPQFPAVEPTVAPFGAPQLVRAGAVDPLEIWHVLAWEAQAPVETQLNGSPADVSGETLYIWTAQKEQ